MLSGCSHAIEPNDLAYIVAVGFDKNYAEKAYDITLQIANPQAISGGADEGGGEGGKKTITNLTVTSSDIFSAVNLANHVYSKDLSLAHTKLLVFSDELAKEGELKHFSETIARSEELRPNAFLSVAKGSAKEYLGSIKPTNEVNPVKYYEVIYDVEYTAYIPKNQVKDFYAYEQTPERENVLPLSAVKKEVKKESAMEDEGTQNIYPGVEYFHKNYIAGEIELGGEIETQTCGMAVFRDGKMVEECGAVEALLYNLLTGDYSMSEISYRNKNMPEKPVTVIQTQRKKPKVSVDIKGSKPKIEIKLYLEADLRTLNEGHVIEMEIDDFEQQVSREIEASAEKFLYKTAQEFESDIVGFGSHIKRCFDNFSEFEAYGWETRYPESEFDVDVEFAIRRSGLINKKEG